jgi:hypothetical protein
MTLTSMPRSLWQVTVPSTTTRNRIFTTRDEVRTYRRTLRTEGFGTSTVTRYRVQSGVNATV